MHICTYVCIHTYIKYIHMFIYVYICTLKVYKIVENRRKRSAKELHKRNFERVSKKLRPQTWQKMCQRQKKTITTKMLQLYHTWRKAHLLKILVHVLWKIYKNLNHSLYKSYVYAIVCRIRATWSQWYSLLTSLSIQILINYSVFAFIWVSYN